VYSFLEEFAAIERRHHLMSSALTPMRRLKNSSLVVNYVNGGGYLPGVMATWAGPEAAGKSTFVMDALGRSLLLPLRMRVHNDAENAVDPEYTPRIMGLPEGLTLADLHREIDGQPPYIRYRDETSIGRVFLAQRDMLLKMPAKRYFADAKTWAYTFERKKGMLERIRSIGFSPDKHLSTEGFYVCPTDYDGPEGVIANDSYPAMMPESFMEEGEEVSNQLAVVAKEFSKYLAMVVGLLRSRGVIMLGVNQLRTNPGKRFGDPRYEPGGDALKFYSGLRNWVEPRNCPYGESKNVETEPSVFGPGMDTYHYKLIKNTKNKNGSPLLQGWVRFWVSDPQGVGRGIDPVFDTYAYLEYTGRLIGAATSRKAFKVLWGGEWLDFTWDEFKRAILLPGSNYNFREVLMREFDAPNYKSFLSKAVAPKKGKAGTADAADDEADDFVEDDEEGEPF
jgi:hypothetical protein